MNKAVTLLAIETSTELCSVALLVGGELTSRVESDRKHASVIIPMVSELLADAGIDKTRIDVLAFGQGPGQFTSLRIGVGVVQGIACALDIPVVPVSSLAAQAHGVNAPRVLSASDARMNQVYWAAYENNADGMPVLMDAEVLANPESVPLPEGRGWIGVGTAWTAYFHKLTERLGDRLESVKTDSRPLATSVARIGLARYEQGIRFPAEEALPFYLRDKVAKNIEEQQRDQNRDIG